MKCLKSTATLLTEQKSITPISVLSNEILCIFVAQGAAKWWEVKVGCQKKILARKELNPFLSNISNDTHGDKKKHFF